MSEMEFVKAEMGGYQTDPTEQTVLLNVFVDGVLDLLKLSRVDAIALRDALNEMLPPDIRKTDMNTEQLLETITGAKKRADVVPAYRKGIIENRSTIDWPKVNSAIMERWSRPALIHIKTQVWKQ